jgi:histidinol-phosphate phosphatase family protein
MNTERVRVAVIGCGLIGRRRAAAAAADPATRLQVAVDADAERASEVAALHGAESAKSWESAVARADVDAVVVCTPNALLAPIAVAALEAGKHVLVEKPIGRNQGEAELMASAAASAGRVLKIGFNHRYHPAIDRAAELLRGGAVGRLIQLRARYGHGSRPGCEKEWRGNLELAGGGELLDQGVHVVDLFQWLAGAPLRVQAELQTAVWPLAPLEDNAWALMRFGHGVVGHFHVSMTQWKNLFSLEIHGTEGALVVEGLGGSYGTERLTVVRRNLAGGVPAVETVDYPGPDASWAAEWSDFAGALLGGRMLHGYPGEGVSVMRTVGALYAAGRTGTAVDIASPAVFLDRDGVLNEVVHREGKPASPRRLDELTLVRDVDVVSRLQQAGFRVFIITNQPDLKRGITSPAEMHEITGAITGRIPIDEVAICPHDDGDDCGCRKPAPGMILDLALRWNVDLARSWVIGDMWRDVEAARLAGCASILLRRNYNIGTEADYVVDTLSDAVRLVTTGGASYHPSEHVRN